MKFLALAAATLVALLASKSATAQVATYDVICNATTANYYTGPGGNTGADTFIPDPTTNVCNVDGIFVATAPGTYCVIVCFWNNGCFGVPPIICYCFCPITIATAGVYQISFPIAPPVSVAPATTGDWSGVSFNVVQNCVNQLPATGLYPAFDNAAACVGLDEDGFSIDTNQNGLFEACTTEWYTFNPAWTNANMLVTVSDGCPSPSARLNGPFVSGTPTVRKLDMPSKEIKNVVRPAHARKPR